MLKLTLFIALISLSNISSAAEPEPDKSITLTTPTPLIGITAVDDFTSSIEEPNASEAGAMGMQRLFSTNVIAELKTCLSNVQGVFTDWHTEHKLIPSQQTITDKRLKLRIWDKDKKGVFEGGYELNIEDNFVRASLDYYRLNGDKVAPEAINRMVETYHLSQLWSKLAEAIECD